MLNLHRFLTWFACLNAASCSLLFGFESRDVRRSHRSVAVWVLLFFSCTARDGGDCCAHGATPQDGCMGQEGLKKIFSPSRPWVGACSRCFRELPSLQLKIEKLSMLTGCLRDDLVIIDSPPLRPVVDSIPLARYVEATLLVTMLGQTNSNETEGALESRVASTCPDPPA